MARPVKFDFDLLINKAMHLFWRQGYGGTSVQDLGQALDLHPGSIYNTFGDKQALFLAALDHYAATTGCYLIDLLRQSGSGLPAIERVFQTSVERLSSPQGQQGCLMTNTAVECSNVNPEAVRKVALYQQKVEDALIEALQKAQQEGQMATRTAEETQTLARFLNGCLQGMRVLARSGPDARPRLEAMAKMAVQAIR